MSSIWSDRSLTLRKPSTIYRGVTGSSPDGATGTTTGVIPCVTGMAAIK